MTGSAEERLGQEDCIDHLGEGNGRRNSINRRRYELQRTTKSARM